jgi:phosphate/phosphite/phosphonate ABC transporter binding protein
MRAGARIAGAISALALGFAACRARAPEPSGEIDERIGVMPKAEGVTNVPPRLVLGLLPIFEPDELIQAYAPFAKYLGDELGTKVEVKLSTDYQGMVEMVLEHQVDLVQLAPLAYVVAKAKDDSISLLATNISEGSSTYSGYILVRADSPIQRATDFRGKRFGFVELESTTGYLYPYAFFLEQGILPERDFKEVVMAKRHDLVIEELMSGRVDGAATFSGALLNAESKGVDTDRLRIVAKTGRVPYDAWCVRGGLDLAIRDRITSSLLKLSTRTLAGRKILTPLRSINGFASTTDASYDDVRRLKKLVDAARE